MKGTGGRGAVLWAAPRLVAPGGRLCSPGALLVAGGVVAAAGTAAEVAPLVPPGTGRIDLPGHVLLPGLVNAHAHLQMAPLPVPGEGGGMVEGAQGAPFVEWLLSVVAWRRSADPSSFARNLADGAAEALASGTTAVGEIAGPDLPAYGALPLRARLFVEAIGFHPGSADGVEASAREGLERVSSLARENGRLSPGLSPHTPYTVGEELLGRLGRLAASLGLPVSLHLAESAAERRFLADGGGAVAEALYPAVGVDVSWFRGIGPSLPAYLGRAGLLRRGVSAVHGVHLAPDEAEALAAAGLSFVLCPRSNRLLGNGSPDVSLFLDRGYAVSLGTDGRGSVPTLSMWDELREALSLYRGGKARGDAARLLFLAATEGGARALDLPCGALAPGLPADFLAVVDPGGEGDGFFLRLAERTGAGEVRHVRVDGRPAFAPPARAAEPGGAAAGGRGGGTTAPEEGG